MDFLVFGMHIIENCSYFDASFLFKTLFLANVLNFLSFLFIKKCMIAYYFSRACLLLTLPWSLFCLTAIIFCLVPAIAFLVLVLVLQFSC